MYEPKIGDVIASCIDAHNARPNQWFTGVIEYMDSTWLFIRRSDRTPGSGIAGTWRIARKAMNNKTFKTQGNRLKALKRQLERRANERRT